MRQILRQTSWLVLAQVLTRAIGFFYTIFLARNLGVSDFGLYSVALAYLGVLSAVSDFGFNRFLIREIAIQKYKPAELICNIGVLRLTVSSIIFAILALGLYFFDPDSFRISIVLLTVMTLLPQSMTQTLDGVFIATAKLQFSALSLIFLNLSTTILGLMLILNGFGTTGAVAALILGQLIYLFILTFFLKLLRIKLLSKVTTEILKQVTAGSLPYGILAVMGLLYFRVDTLILSYIKGNFDTGIYSVGYKFLEALIFIPTALAAALFPIFSKLHGIDHMKIKAIYFRSLKFVLTVSLLIVLSYLFILPQIIRLFLPDYLASIPVVQILSLAIPFIFLHIPLSSVLLSSEKYLKQIILLSLIPFIFNVMLNLIFIPIFGIFAAAWITVASDIISFLTIFIFIQRFVFKHA